jgi:DNA repair exonuclease SbcCD nuclease subunit
MTTTVEYGVRRSGTRGEPIVMPVGDETLMRQTLAELLDEGAKAEPVRRVVSPWEVDDRARARVQNERTREAILAIAQRAWEEEITLTEAVDELAEHSDLPASDRTRLLGELLDELTHQERVDRDEVPPGRGQDKQALVEDAERRVNEAADKLIGSPS